MPVERTTGGSSLIDVLDRVLDKGIVIDAWVRVSLVGIDLITVEARVVVASIDTYLKYSEAVGSVTPEPRRCAPRTPRCGHRWPPAATAACGGAGRPAPRRRRNACRLDGRRPAVASGRSRPRAATPAWS